MVGPAIRLVPDRIFAGDDEGIDAEFAAPGVNVIGSLQCCNIDAFGCGAIWAWWRFGDAEDRSDARIEPEAFSPTATKVGSAVGEYALKFLVTGVVEVLEVQLWSGAKLHFG